MLDRLLRRRRDKKAERQQNYETIGKQVMALYDAINPDRVGLYRTAFFKGIFTGVGVVVGTTLVVAVLLWVLSLTHSLPFLGPITDNVRHTIQEHK
jgi:hypothetical protein